MKSKKDLIKKIAALYVKAAKWVTTAPPQSLEMLKDVEEAPADFKAKIDEFARLRKLAEQVVQSARIREIYDQLEKAYAEMGARDAWNESNKLLTEIESKGQALEAGLYKGAEAAAYVGAPDKVTDAQVAKEVLKMLTAEMPELEGKIKELLDAAKAGVRVVEVFQKELLETTQKLEEEREKQEKDKGKTTKIYQRPAPAGAPSPATSSAYENLWIRTAKDAEKEFHGWLETMDELMGEAAELATGMAAGMEELADSVQELSSMEGYEDMSAEQPAEEMAQPEMSEAPAEEMEAVPAAQGDNGLKAEAKAFPSEHDQSGNFLEVVEADGQKKLVVRKDVKSKISRKVAEHFSGAFNMNDAVVVDFGDYMADGRIAGYEGDGIYAVAMNDGRKMRVPSASLFSAARNLWGE